MDNTERRDEQARVDAAMTAMATDEWQDRFAARAILDRMIQDIRAEFQNARLDSMTTATTVTFLQHAIASVIGAR